MKIITVAHADDDTVIILAHPFLSVAIDPSTGYIILGAADGKVTGLFYHAMSF